MGQTGVIKIVVLVLLPYISFIIAFKALECSKRYWETICAEFKNWSDLPHEPLYGSNWGHKNSSFGSFALYHLYYCFYSFRMY